MQQMQCGPAASRRPAPLVGSTIEELTGKVAGFAARLRGFAGLSDVGVLWGPLAVAPQCGEQPAARARAQWRCLAGTAAVHQ